MRAHTEVLLAALRLLRPFWLTAAGATLLGGIGGLTTAWLLATINEALHAPGGPTPGLALRFALLCATSVLGRALAGVGSSHVGQQVIAALRKEVAGKILRAPIAALEAQRSHRLMSVLTGDVETVSAFTFSFSGYVIALAIVVGSFAYLLMLSPVILLLAILSLSLGALISLLARRGWIRDYEAVRAAQDELYQQYRAIIDGAKELKMSRPRRARVHGILLAGAADRIATLKSHAMRLHWLADAGGSAVFFLAIGLLIAAEVGLGLDARLVSGAVIVLLYVKSPVEQIAGAVPIFDQARIAFARIAALSAELDQQEPNVPLALGASATGAAFRAIELRDVTYAFPALEGTPPFALGPIDLTVRAGELLFIVGDNGSGKTTLIKLLLGLYAPREGTVLLDGQPVEATSRDGYRQLFTTIFSDYYLFDDLAEGGLPGEAQPYLARLGIAHRVRLQGDRFSTTDLSTGQRKRLALVQARLERRPVIVTDEWAADQDPDFRRVFYEELLMELKAEGRTLIVISHDDRYFHVADRIVRLAEGRVVEDRLVRVPEPVA